MRKSIKAIGLFGGLFHATGLTKIFHIFFLIISAIILLITSYYPRKLLAGHNIKGQVKSITSLFRKNSFYLLNTKSEQFKILEYSLIILFIITGAMLLMSSSDLISMFLSIELQSYGLYILSTIYKNSESSTKGGLTYFLLGGLSSCFILLGSCLLYSNTGTTNLDGIYVITSLTSQYSTEKGITIYEPSYINISLIIMAVGFLFKVSAAPFHFWSPDVYDAVPTIVTTFVAIVAKISIFIFLVELLHYTARNFYSLPYPLSESLENGYGFTWLNCLLISCLLSLIIGTILGLTQNRIKRLFAYSTISHIGFILLALSIDSVESIQAFLFYLMQYSISNLNAFLILIAVGYLYLNSSNSKEFKYICLSDKEKLTFNSKTYFDKLDKETLKNQVLNNNNELDQHYSPITLTKQLKSLFFRSPYLALSLTITIFSFLGIPPLIGFFAKQMVLSAALDSGYYFLTIVAVLTSVISAVYYLNIIMEMFTLSDSKVDYWSIKNTVCYSNERYELSSYLTITISIITLGIILFIFMPKEWLSMANILALNLNNT